MKGFTRLSLAMTLALANASMAYAATAKSGDSIQIQDMVLTVPEGWSLRQDAKDEGTLILGFENGEHYLTLFVKQSTGLDMQAMFVNGSRVVRDVHAVPRNSYAWKMLQTEKTVSGKTAHVAAFLTEHAGHSYYGYARGPNAQAAQEAVFAFLQDLR